MVSKTNVIAVIGVILIVLVIGVMHVTDAGASEGYDYMQRCLDATDNSTFCTSLQEQEVLVERCHEENRPGTPLHCHWDRPVDHEH